MRLLHWRPVWWRPRVQCLLCGGAAEQAALPLCAGCDDDLPWLAGHCTVCALPLPVTGLTCGQCLRRAPAFHRVETPLRYGFPVDALITRFKHQANAPLGRLLGQLLERHLLHAFDEGLPRPDRLIPVPLSRRRERQRGFNQAQLLAQWLATPLGLPVDDHLVRRTQDTPAQQGLDAATRKRNLRSAFALGDGARVEGLHLALVDDVLTTGATAERIARLLRRAGARRVDVYCLARTPPPQ
ncbi:MULTISPECIES: ComF family protein [Pseudomonas]|uniref:Amidophosphoribosyltransferase n=1 Tax=Pseudomonas nitroreducens TaxID=46680 RepID=A0A246FE39_PSENT|nr:MULTISPECIES: ComF family protein [Pseudomonas]MCG8908828.1 ComF family protein [Pseudomonas sp. DP-17]OWP52584.1 amidophosphoribosyltransferase [Pseudomonas nitroreducens]